jgi:hypothetical protein
LRSMIRRIEKLLSAEVEVARDALLTRGIQRSARRNPGRIVMPIGVA